MCVICYAIASVQAMFTTEWFVEMLGFIAVGVICDGISQYIGFYYNKIRFRKKINEALLMKSEIAKAMNEQMKGNYHLKMSESMSLLMNYLIMISMICIGS